MMVAVIPQDNDLRYGRHLVEKDMKGRFQRLEACGGVRLIGGEVEEVKVLVDYDAMEAKGLSLEYISQQLASSNFQYPAGTIEAGEKELLVKTNGFTRASKKWRIHPCCMVTGDWCVFPMWPGLRWGARNGRPFSCMVADRPSASPFPRLMMPVLWPCPGR